MIMRFTAHKNGTYAGYIGATIELISGEKKDSIFIKKVINSKSDYFKTQHIKNGI